MVAGGDVALNLRFLSSAQALQRGFASGELAKDPFFVQTLATLETALRTDEEAVPLLVLVSAYRRGDLELGSAIAKEIQEQSAKLDLLLFQINRLNQAPTTQRRFAPRGEVVAALQNTLGAVARRTDERSFIARPPDGMADAVLPSAQTLVTEELLSGGERLIHDVGTGLSRIGTMLEGLSWDQCHTLLRFLLVRIFNRLHPELQRADREAIIEAFRLLKTLDRVSGLEKAVVETAQKEQISYPNILRWLRIVVQNTHLGLTSQVIFDHAKAELEENPSLRSTLPPMGRLRPTPPPLGRPPTPPPIPAGFLYLRPGARLNHGADQQPPLRDTVEGDTPEWQGEKQAIVQELFRLRPDPDKTGRFGLTNDDKDKPNQPVSDLKFAKILGDSLVHEAHRLYIRATNYGRLPEPDWKKLYAVDPPETRDPIMFGPLQYHRAIALQRAIEAARRHGIYIIEAPERYSDPALTKDKIAAIRESVVKAGQWLTAALQARPADWTPPPLPR